MANREKLKRIMLTEELTYKDVAELLEVKLETVKSWLHPDTCKAARKMPNHRIKSLHEACRSK